MEAKAARCGHTYKVLPTISGADHDEEAEGCLHPWPAPTELVAFDKGCCPQYLVLAFCKMGTVLLTAWAQCLRVGSNPEVRVWIPSSSLAVTGITLQVANTAGG